MVSCPMVMIAGTNSGAGKTSVALALTRALSRRGKRVQTFKVGPDFLDPTYLAIASGRPCYNLDGWMAGGGYCSRLVARTTADADCAIVEGVMGLFDGADPQSSEGSAAEIARLLDIPILLIANVHGMARSFAALVLGFTTFEPDLRFAGVIANHCGSDRHAEWLSLSLKASGLPPLVGAIPRGAFPEMPSRHLGLVTADREIISESFLDVMADVVDQQVAIERLFPTAPAVSQAEAGIETSQKTEPFNKTNENRHIKPNAAGRPKVRSIDRKGALKIGVARDKAFHFYYTDLLDELATAGCEIVFFSPLADGRLPGNLSGLYLGGGYPELFAEKLSSNRDMLQQIRDYADSGRPLYAECGGLMYLSLGIESNGSFHPLAGILPARTRMRAGRKALGYVEASLTKDSLWGRAGEKIRGHEFHYSELIDDPTATPGWETIYTFTRRRSEKTEAEGFQSGSVLASYLHLHLASRPEAIHRFIEKCGGKP